MRADVLRGVPRGVVLAVRPPYGVIPPLRAAQLLGMSGARTEEPCCCSIHQYSLFLGATTEEDLTRVTD